MTAAGEPSPSGTHTQTEGQRATINLRDHADRTESSWFVDAKRVFHKIMATLAGLEPYGAGPWQAHHGGSIWVHDGKVWLLFRNLLGVEWSLQFLAMPEKIEALRLNALALVEAFPNTQAELLKLGGQKQWDILHTPVTDAATIAAYVDSLWNSCIPLRAGVHVGILSAKNSTEAGAHHYPDPTLAGQYIKHPDYVYWVIDSEGKPAAVAPVAPKGSGVSDVKVEYATPGTALHDQHQEAHAAGKRLILPGHSDLAMQAFANQQAA